MTDTPHDIAHQITLVNPGVKKHEWGVAMVARLRAAKEKVYDDWLEERLVDSVGRYCANVDASYRQDQAPKTSWNGRQMTPTISVGGQQKLWLDATPTEFIAAVHIEENVAKGRLDSNAVRWRVAKVIEADPVAVQSATLADALDYLGIDPEGLKLEDLA